MKCILFLLFVSSLLPSSYSRELIESDATEFLNIDFSLLSKNSSNNVTNPIVKPNVTIIKIEPSFGVSDMKVKLYCNNLNYDEPYFINVCNTTIIGTCLSQSCKFITFTMPNKTQGVCPIILENQDINFTYTIATSPITLTLDIDIDLNNITTKELFIENIKLAIVNSLNEINNTKQIYICDTCISKVNISRRLLSNQIKIIFTIVSSKPIYINQKAWKISQSTNIINNINEIVNSLEELQNQYISLVNVESDNYQNSSSPFIVNERVKNTDYVNIIIIVLSSLFLLLFIWLIYYIYKEYQLQKNRNSKQDVITTSEVVTIDGEEFIVHEIH